MKFNTNEEICCPHFVVKDYYNTTTYNNFFTGIEEKHSSLF